MTKRSNIANCPIIARDQLDAMLDSAQDAFVGADSKGIITFWNRAAARIFAYDKNQAMGQPLTLLIPERYLAAHMADMHRVQTTGISKVSGSTVELVGRRADGSEFPLEMAISHYNQDGELCFTGIIRDISAAKANAANLQAAENELRKANETLEKRVRERTQALTEALERGLQHKKRTDAILRQIPASIAIYTG